MLRCFILNCFFLFFSYWICNTNKKHQIVKKIYQLYSHYCQNKAFESNDSGNSWRRLCPIVLHNQKVICPEGGTKEQGAGNPQAVIEVDVLFARRLWIRLKGCLFFSPPFKTETLLKLETIWLKKVACFIKEFWKLRKGWKPKWFIDLMTSIFNIMILSPLTKYLN